MPWNGLNDPDAFYHAKMTSLLWALGPLHVFPWLDLTLIGQHFADLHFLFHVLLVPFVQFFGLFQGLRLASIIFAALFMAAFEACLRWFKVPHSLIWTALLAFTQPFVFRLLLGKATPLALIWYVLGLTSAWKRKPWLMALICMLFALSHAGWIYLAGSIVLMCVGRILYDKIVAEKSWSDCVAACGWREALAAFMGGACGLLLHPNFPQDIVLSWTQIFTIGLGTPFQHVVLGTEWQPADLAFLSTTFAPWIIVALGGMAGLFVAARRPLDQARAQLAICFGLIFAVLLALTVKSVRNVEYLGPSAALWCAAIWSMVDERRLGQQLREHLKQYSKLVSRSITVVFILVLAVVLWREADGIWRGFHSVHYPDSIYRATVSAISSRAQTGDRIFNSSWDEFPMLFAADDRLKYISGLDPTFLYAASSTLSDDVTQLTLGQTTSTKEQAWELIHDKLDSKFVFVSRKFHQKFLELLAADPRYVKIADNSDSLAFQVKP